MSREKKQANRKLILRWVLFLISVYMYCVVFDPFFFDYRPCVLPLRQLYGCLLAAGVLYICVRLRYVGALIYAAFAVLSAGLFYAYKVFGYSVGFELVNAAMTTNRHELAGFISCTFVLSLCGYFVVIPLIYMASVYAFGWRKISARTVWGILAVGVSWGLLYEIPPYTIGVRHGLYLKLADNTMRRDPELFSGSGLVHAGLVYNRWRLPYSNLGLIHGGIKEYCREVMLDESESYASFSHRKDEPLTFILVIGESVRADHVPAGGYSRNTMPNCTAEPNACFYSKMYSYASSTHYSCTGLLAGLVNKVPHTLRTSFAAILKKHGYVCNLYSENTTNITDTKLFNGLLGRYMESCQSVRLPIEEIARKIVSEAESCEAEKQLLVIENGTGHYPYVNENCYDCFVPCNLNGMESPLEHNHNLMVNDYDNCLIAVDAFLGRLIDGFRQKNAVLLYVSDHGQFLGENGKLMHGDLDNELLRHVASFIWFSDEYERRHPELVAEMKSVKDKLLVHGQIYATVLKLCGIESEVPLDIGDFVKGDVREVEHNLPKSMNVPSRVVEK